MVVKVGWHSDTNGFETAGSTEVGWLRRWVAGMAEGMAAPRGCATAVAQGEGEEEIWVRL